MNLLNSFAKLAVAVAASLAAVAKPVLAHCPLCAAATAGGVAATRFLGVDDTVTGTFIGGFVASTGLWFSNWLTKKRNGKALLQFQGAVFVALSLALTVLTLYLARLLGSPDPTYTMLGVDKLLVGTIAGTAVSLAAFRLHKWIRAVNSNKSFVPFQGIIVTMLALSATAAAFYLAT